MSDYLGIARDRIEVSPLGISLEGHEPVERSYDGPLEVGYFARIAPEKGLHILAEAVSHDERTRRASRGRISAARTRQLPEVIEREIRRLARSRGEDRISSVHRRLLYAEPLRRPERTLPP